MLRGTLLQVERATPAATSTTANQKRAMAVQPAASNPTPAAPEAVRLAVFLTHSQSCNAAAVQTHDLLSEATCQSKECSKATGLCALQEAAAPAEEEKKGKKKKKKDKTEGSVDSVDDGSDEAAPQKGAATKAAIATVSYFYSTQPPASHAQG